MPASPNGIPLVANKGYPMLETSLRPKKANLDVILAALDAMAQMCMDCCRPLYIDSVRSFHLLVGSGTLATSCLAEGSSLRCS